MFHGTPSGVDNTACCHGGYLLYEKNKHPQFTPVTVSSPPRILVVNSKEAHNTASIVLQVRAQRHRLSDTFRRIGEIALSGEEQISRGGDIGHLITENQNLLNLLPGVANARTDKIVQICGQYGVPAKITGAGGGGAVIGLFRDGVDVEGLDKVLTDAGFQVIWDIETGVEGVHVVE